MSAALINRSLTNVRTELEFLYDSEVIDKALFDKLMDALPRRYAKDMAPWGVEKLAGGSGPVGPPKAVANSANSEKPTPSGSETDSIADSLKKTSLRDDLSPPAHPPVAAPLPERAPAPALGYCKASYNYDSSESGDLKLAKGDLLAVLEHLSPDWWKGYKKGSGPAQAGVFPSNYVVVVSETEFNASSAPEKRPVPLPERPQSQSEKSSYDPQNNSSALAPPMYKQAQHSSNSSYQSGYQQGYQPGPSSGPQGYQQGYQVQPQPQQQPSYGGYAQYPPPSTNYYGQQQMQPQPQQQYQQDQQAAPQGSNGASHFKKFGSKLGNAAIFGAGATIGGDIVNSIF